MPELIGNKAIEQAAIEFVIEVERKAGREAKDTRYRGAPADIESPPRIIEVEAVGKESVRKDGWWSLHPASRKVGHQLFMRPVRRIAEHRTHLRKQARIGGAM